MNPRLSLGLRPQLTLCAASFLAATSLISLATAATSTPNTTENTSPKAIPWTQVGTAARAQYSGDGLTVTPTEHGARLHCVFQRLEGETTREGLWLTSTVTNMVNDQFRVVAVEVGREDATTPLPRTGEVTVAGETVRFIRTGLVEEYTVSLDGLRQDFLVADKPAGKGELQIRLDVSGAQVEKAVHGAQLVLDKSGRKIAYSRLRVTDSNGKELPARIEVVNASKSEMALAVVVNDSDAVYPVRVDPTFSDANWVSLGGINGANSVVSAVVVDNSGNLYIGGAFTVVGDVVAKCIAKWNGTNWSALGSGISGGFSPSVRALAVSGGDLYAGGSFTTAGGISANRIAKWNGNTWSALGSGIGGLGSGSFSSVNALTVSGSDLYAGGSFTTAGGGAANNIAKWNGNAWSALGAGIGGSGLVLPSSVYALAASESDLYAGGSFTTASGVTANYIAKWNGSSWSALGAGFNQPVYALAVSGSDLYAGGSFGSFNTPRYIAKWNGSAWSALGSGMNGYVRALAVSGGDLYAGGEFTTAGGNAASCVAKWNGSAWSALGSGMNGYVSALAVSGSDVHTGGSFTTSDGSGANNFAKWNGSAWSALGSGMGGGSFPTPYVYALAAAGNDLYAGGEFTTAGGSTVNYIAKWNGSAWSALGSGMNGYVKALAVSGSNLYAGGEFTTAGGSAANYIAKWNGSTWSTLGLGMNDYVLALAVSGNDLYAGGEFTTANGDAANRIAKWNGSAWSALGTGMAGSDGFNPPGVYALAVSDGNLYAGGTFSMAGDTAASSIAKWNGSIWSTMGMGVNGYVYALLPVGSDLYVGGNFLSAGDSLATYLAKWDGTSWSGLGGGVDGAVRALTVSGSDLCVGGSFRMAGGSPATYIAKWDGSSWTALASGMNNPVYVLAASGSDVYAGGWFTTAGGKVSASVAKWAPLAFQAKSINFSNGTFQALLTGPDTNSVVVDGNTNFSNWFPVATNTLPPGGAWQLSIPIGTNVHQLYRARLGP